MTQNNHSKKVLFFSIPFALLCVSVFIFSSCKVDEVSTSSGSAPAPVTSTVNKISFSATETKKTITLSGLANQSVYLVKLNNSEGEVASNATGSAASSITDSEISGRTVSDSHDLANDTWGENVSGVFKTPQGTITRLENKNAQEAMTHPPAVSAAPSSASSRSMQSVRNASERNAALVVDTSTRDFLVAVDADESSYKTITAILRGSSAYAQVWVAPQNDSLISPTAIDKITPANAQSIADTFAQIYPVETAIFGYEYGGDPTDHIYKDVNTLVPSGGIDGEKPINILIYDVDYDTPKVSESKSGVVGFFYPKDYDYTKGTHGSNASEIFYIDSWFTANYPGVVYSTLVHEFQHMIGFNEKNIQNQKSWNTWYTEMLSQVAEDMMSTDLESWLGDKYNVVDDGPVNYRMFCFNYLSGYTVSGVTDFFTLPTYTATENQCSYASSFAFGAYLARNYGGAPLIKAIASNNLVNEASITAALTALGKSEKTFQDAFMRYGEALMFSSSGFADGLVPSTCNTFDRTASDVINEHVYSFPAFDLWKLPIVYDDKSTGFISPKVYSTSTTGNIRPYGMYIQSASSWQNVNGNLTITVNKPSNPNVSLSLMVRTAN